MESGRHSFGKVVSPVTQSKALLQGVRLYCHPLDGLRTGTKLSLQDEAYKRSITSKVLSARHLCSWVVSDVKSTEAASSVSMPPGHVIVRDSGQKFERFLGKSTSDSDELQTDEKKFKKFRVRFAEDYRQSN